MVEVHDDYASRAVAGRHASLWTERPVTGSDQNGHFGRAAIRQRHIREVVTVEVSGGKAPDAESRRHAEHRPESPVAVSEDRDHLAGARMPQIGIQSGDDIHPPVAI